MEEKNVKKTTKKTVKPIDDVMQSESAIVHETEQQPVQKPSVKMKPKNIDPDSTVVVKNGFQGKLVYKSKKTGEVFEWEEFGDEQEMELAELRNAKTSAKKFFINNWFMFDDPEIIDYLGLSQYYKFTLNVDGFDDIFSRDPNEVGVILDKLSVGQKRSVAYRAKQLVSDGKIDSHRLMKKLEDHLGIELIEW